MTESRARTAAAVCMLQLPIALARVDRSQRQHEWLHTAIFSLDVNMMDDTACKIILLHDGYVESCVGTISSFKQQLEWTLNQRCP